jgi:hypothetical protein
MTANTEYQLPGSSVYLRSFSAAVAQNDDVPDEASSFASKLAGPARADQLFFGGADWTKAAGLSRRRVAAMLGGVGKW